MYLKLGLSISCALFDHNAKIKEVLNKMSIFVFLWIGTANKQRILVFFAQNKLYWTLSCEATSCPAILCRILQNREVAQKLNNLYIFRRAAAAALKTLHNSERQPNL